MKNKYLNMYAILIFCLSFIISGCGNSNTDIDYRSDVVKLNSNGNISVIMYDTFDKDYYSEDELVSMASEEVNSYNASHGANKIQVGNHSLNDGIISLELIFEDVVTFNDYMPNAMFSGTLGGATISGYDLNRSLNIAGTDGRTIGKTELINMSDSNVIIVNGPYKVETPGKVTYYSQGMDYVDVNSVSASVNGVYFVMYK